MMEGGTLRLDNLPADCELLVGDQVVTTGFGGFVPAGLVIGSVAEVRMDDSGVSPYAVLTPQADLSGITQAVIVKSFDYVA